MTSTLLMLLLYSISLNAQEIPFVPPTYNYTNTHYNAGNQNWAVDQGADGVIYIANNDGLLIFDGVNWELLTLPNNLGVKSILVDNNSDESTNNDNNGYDKNTSNINNYNNRDNNNKSGKNNTSEKIYIGSFEEFGYFEKNSKNRYIYHSLKPLLKDFTFRNDEIWTIHKHGDNLYFQTFSSYFVLDEKTSKITSHKLYPAPLYFFTLNDELFAQFINENIYKFNGTKFKLLLEKTRIKDDVVVAILPFHSSFHLPQSNTLQSPEDLSHNKNNKTFKSLKDLSQSNNNNTLKIIEDISQTKNNNTLQGLEDISQNNINNHTIQKQTEQRQSRTKLLLFTSKNGIYEYDTSSDNLTQWNTEIDSELTSATINRVIMLQDTTYIVGTLNNGIYAIDKDGRLTWHLNRSNGLLNNTVLGLFSDKQNNVWAALDNGLSYIYTNSAISFYEPIDRQIGMVSDILIDEEEAYLSTNQGIYKYDYKEKDIQQLPGGEIQSWYIDKFDDQIITGNNLVTSFINDGTITPITEGSTGGMDIKPASLYNKDILLESTYNDLQVYNNNNGKWTYSHKIAGFSDLINQIEIDHTGNIWAAHMYKGVYKLRTDTELKKITQQTYYSKLDKGKDYESNIGSDKSNKLSSKLDGNLGSNQINQSPIRLMKFKGRIVFTDRNKFYTYDDLTDNIIPFEQLNNELKGLTDTYKIVTVNDSTYWFIRNNEYTLIHHRKGRYVAGQKIPFTLLNNPPGKGRGNIYVASNGISYFCLNGGIGRYIQKDDQPTPTDIDLMISTVWSFDRKNNLRNYIDSNKNSKIPYIGNNLTIKLQYPDYSKSNHIIQCQLEEYDNNWIDISDDLTINYTNLPATKYRFKARALGRDDKILSTLTYQFEIKNPWYKTGWAKTTYIILIIFILLWIVNGYLHRTIQRKNRLFTELEKERISQLEKQETLIAHLKNQKLETDLSHKSKELANATMLIINNEELLSNLKSTIQRNIIEGKFNRVSGTKLVNLIDENLSDEDEWTLFQENFDLIHENFFRKLKHNYPSLTPSDLRLCTLLRLNYTTKEIARMLNLTPRGVEAARYRLRKKLELDGDINLVEFMINFK